ncbi:MAG TPA: glycoside hydrolase family 15 protein [Ferrovibrio sp.]|uniref:glycoside hydrolase family 15 protein n=1 Tax=Ferrovibrio sp. TaxID=1917215 RepID=UPI002ED3CD9E
MPLAIEDYALIGNLHTAALVGRDGSIDWLCLPRFDSPACFAALVGKPENGRWLLQPDCDITEVKRRYRDDTLILETEFTTEAGRVTVSDFMPVPADERRVDLFRIVTGRQGKVPMRMEAVFRFGYGDIVPWVTKSNGGIHAIAGPDAVFLHSPTETHGENDRTLASFEVSEGQSLPFMLSWTRSHQPEPGRLDPYQALQQTETWWTGWIGRCTYTGPWRHHVVRSLCALKALTYEPTGGIVAAPTTSLPERIGGIRNWDYRLCWLRDATFTLYALLQSGFDAEAAAWREWLLRAIAGKPDQLQIMYSIVGERDLHEREIPWLDGYKGSKPVLIGNDAHTQLQLDVYGEVMDVFHGARKHQVQSEKNAWEVQKVLLDFLESNWRRKDFGIWEVRARTRNFTHSKVMAWVAADRAVKAIEQFGLDGPVERWRALAATIHDDVCAQGFNPEIGSFVQHYGGEELDAALLMIPLVGFLPPQDRRVKGTVAAIERELVHDGLVRRYSSETGIDGLPPGEGAFLACTFWLADNYAMLGRWSDAENLFRHLLSLTNDVGLLAEQYDPIACCQLGNFPQAFSHVALIGTAYNLASRSRASASRRSAEVAAKEEEDTGDNPPADAG